MLPFSLHNQLFRTCHSGLRETSSRCHYEHLAEALAKADYLINPSYGFFTQKKSPLALAKGLLCVLDDIQKLLFGLFNVTGYC